ncbi:MAG: hypothetical protein U9O94_00180 [Nanoarchaeota archaeon]|nr:hypothetical protein [Nanoarchaeota archaeon]
MALRTNIKDREFNKFVKDSSDNTCVRVLDAHDAQSPLDTDGDSVYEKDLETSLSDVGTFETYVYDGGSRAATDEDVGSLFNDLYTGLQDSTAGDNPKWFKFFLNRPVTIGSIGINAHTGDFSNVKITLLNSQGGVIATLDDSANNTKYTNKSYPLVAKNVCCILVEFYTADQVNASFLRIQKYIAVVSRTKLIKPDGTEVEMQGTTSGNAKISLEEFETGISSNSKTQLNVTQFLSDGTEGSKVAGLSGASTDGSVSLASADTWYQMPSTAPTSGYVLVISKETVAGTSRWSFSGDGVPASGNGNKFSSDDIIFTLGANEVVYVGSSTAGDVVNWTSKVI